MSIGQITADEKYVYGITSNGFSGITPPPKPLVFWVFDPVTEKVLFKQTLTSTGGVLVFRVPQTGHIWLVDNEGCHLFDSVKMQFDQTLAWPKEAGRPDGGSSVDTRGNKAWIFANNQVVRLEDGDKPQLKVLFHTEQGGYLAAGADGELYYTQGKQLWKVTEKDEH